MVPKYYTQSIDSAKKELIQTTPAKTRRRHRFYLLLLANIIVWNAFYGLYTAEEDTPIWQAVLTDNVIYELWKKNPLISKAPRKGTVMGILFNQTNPMALINNELVHEGDTIGDVKVVQINPKKIQFEKNGKMWAQAVQEKPKRFW